MTTNWPAMIALGMATMATACTDSEPMITPDPEPAQPSYPTPSFDPGDQQWLAGQPHDLGVEWHDSDGSLLACGFFGVCPSPVDFTVVSVDCTNCVVTDPSPSATHNGKAAFVVTPTATGDVQLHMVIKSTDTQDMRSIVYESTADAYRGLDVHCYVVTAAAPQTATPCGATRAADDQVVFEVAAAMASGRLSYIEPDDLARVTIAGGPAVVWTGPTLLTADSNIQLADIVSAAAPLSAASADVAWTDGAGEQFAVTVAIPAIAQ